MHAYSDLKKKKDLFLHHFTFKDKVEFWSGDCIEKKESGIDQKKLIT